MIHQVNLLLVAMVIVAALFVLTILLWRNLSCWIAASRLKALKSDIAQLQPRVQQGYFNELLAELDGELASMTKCLHRSTFSDCGVINERGFDLFQDAFYKYLAKARRAVEYKRNIFALSDAGKELSALQVVAVSRQNACGRRLEKMLTLLASKRELATDFYEGNNFRGNSRNLKRFNATLSRAKVFAAAAC